jgi:hypothetical protein
METNRTGELGSIGDSRECPRTQMLTGHEIEMINRLLPKGYSLQTQKKPVLQVSTFYLDVRWADSRSSRSGP